MRSPVYWAVLGLVIERPSYGYELLKRFEREYGQMLPLSSESHVYRALDVLRGRGLIEDVLTAGHGTASGRQPRPRYRSTIEGIRGYRDWLIARVRQDHRPSGLFARELAVLAREPDVALEIIDCCEQACTKRQGVAGGSGAGAAVDEVAGLAARLVDEESRLTEQATLPWVRYARSEFEALARARTSQGGRDGVEAACGAHGARARRGVVGSSRRARGSAHRAASADAREQGAAGRSPAQRAATARGQE
jgi:DNA-binding PadR family transcriptional regulator